MDSLLKKIKDNKKIIIVVVIALVLFIVFFKALSLVRHDNHEELIYNKNNSFIKQQEFKGLVFKDITCTYDGKNSLISYTISNKTKKKAHLNNYKIYVKDKKKNLISKIVANVGQDIGAKKEITMANQVVGVDLSDAYYMTIEMESNSKDE